MLDINGTDGVRISALRARTAGSEQSERLVSPAPVRQTVSHAPQRSAYLTPKVELDVAHLAGKAFSFSDRSSRDGVSMSGCAKRFLLVRTSPANVPASRHSRALPVQECSQPLLECPQLSLEWSLGIQECSQQGLEYPLACQEFILAQQEFILTA